MMQHWKLIACFAAGIGLIAALVGAAGRERSEEVPVPGEVTFSVESGFYDEPFYLELTGEGEIHYTLDATDPDENAMLYTGPLLIEDASPNDNVYSMNTDVALDLTPSLISDNGAKPRYPYEAPAFPVDKATVVRAACIDPLGNCGSIHDGVYFVGYGEKSGYGGVKIMSVTTDPRNLFDPETGIYVLGNKWNEAQKNGMLSEDQPLNYLFWDANYRQKGMEWERKAYVCCFDEDGTQIASGDYGIRIQGRGSRARLPKSLNIIGRKEYGSEPFDGESLFGVPMQLDNLNLNNGGNDVSTFLKDYIVNELAADLKVGARPYTPCVLFLDGEYWGLYWLTPRLKEDYLTQRYDVDSSNIVQVKEGSIETGYKKDIHLYEDMVTFIADNDMALRENYEQACELIDIDSCVDYYALEIYIANEDWPRVNRAQWRTRVKAGGTYSDCRWRWLLYDVNLAMITSWEQLDGVQRAINGDPMFASLMDNPDFRAALEDKLVELATVTFEPDRVEAFVEGYKAQMAEAVEKRYKRFYGENKSMNSFYRGCDSIAIFFRKRNSYIINQYGGKDQ